MPGTLRALPVSGREVRRIAQRSQVDVSYGSPYARWRIAVWCLPVSYYYKHALQSDAVRREQIIIKIT